MQFLAILFIVLLTVLQSQVCNPFDGFMQAESWHPSKQDISSMLFHGVNENCNSTIKSLDSQTRWRYFDSWGKPGSGILSGNVKWFGAFDQCLEISDSKYCLVTVLGKFRTNATIPIWYGICLPDACNVSDIFTGLQNFVNNVSNPFFPSVRIIDLSCYEEPSYTTAVIFTIIFCGMILFCCAIGTAIDVYKESFSVNNSEHVCFAKQNGFLDKEKEQVESYLGNEVLEKMAIVTETTPLIRPSRKQNGLVDSLKLKTTEEEKSSKPPAEDTVENLRPNGIVTKFFLCFSLVRNSRDILKTDVGSGAITSLFGMRVVSMFWIVLAHTYAFSRPPNQIIENTVEFLKQAENFSMMIITNGFPSVDTFFFLSGLLLMYTIMKKLHKNNGEIQWGKIYLHRYLRLTPALMFTILFIVQLEPFVDKGPLWQIHVDNQNCDKYWWTNLLYINNFYPTNVVKDSCLQWTWYLSVDMQCFVISPIIIYLFYRYGYRAVIGTSIFLGTVSIVCIAAITKHYNLHPLSESLPNTPASSGIDKFNYLYVKPYCRVLPYLVGLVFGYLMHRQVFKAKQLKWHFAVILWFIAAAAALSLIYGPFTAFSDDPRPWTMFEKIFYSTTRHLVWPLVLTWVVYACEYGYGGYVHDFLSWKVWIPLSRLTYCTYLIHCQLLQVMYSGYRSSLVFSTQWWAYIYCAALLLSYGVAFVLALTIEVPCANLEKLLFIRNHAKNPK